MSGWTQVLFLQAYGSALLFALSVGVSHCAEVSPPTALGAFSAPIHWDANAIAKGSSRATLTLPIEILGRACHIQVDTGANYRLRLNDNSGGTVQEVTLSFGAAQLKASVTKPWTDRLSQATECGVIGTVGNALFESGTIAVDLDHARFSFVPGSRLGKTEGQSINYVRPPGWEGGYLILPLAINGVTYQAALDTGAASFGFVAFDSALWQRLHDQTASSAATKTAVVKTAVGHTSCTRAKNWISATVGGEAVELPLGFCEYQPTLPVPSLDGVLGLAPFHSGVIVIDYVGQRWLHAVNQKDARFGQL